MCIFFLIRNMFFCFIKNNLFTFWHLFFKKTNNSLPKSSVIHIFCVWRLSRYNFLVFLDSFLQKFCWFLQFSLIDWVLSFKNLFLYLDLFIIALWSSLVMKGALFSWMYFFWYVQFWWPILEVIFLESNRILLLICMFFQLMCRKDFLLHGTYHKKILWILSYVFDWLSCIQCLTSLFSINHLFFVYTHCFWCYFMQHKQFSLD